MAERGPRPQRERARGSSGRRAGPDATEFFNTLWSQSDDQQRAIMSYLGGRMMMEDPEQREGSRSL
jgi:hypothetical protein